MIPNLLSIAGSDPSGGAGVQADLKTFSALGCYGMAAITALTAQNTRGVSDVHVPSAQFVAAQIDAIFEDIEVAAVKIGMLATGFIIEAVAKRLCYYKPRFIVLDPVLAATSGDALASSDAAEAMVRYIFPLATVVTPNFFEASRLSGHVIAADHAGMRRAAGLLHARGARAVLLKGGHVPGPTSDDLLFDGASYRAFSTPRIGVSGAHGTGCTLSSAIAVYLAKGLPLPEAIEAAKAYLTAALAAADQLTVGQGIGPVHHFHELWPSAPKR
ncbi:bifunctional hydroxymethylpyrimidine kinase/phosphomethylpyrimidine kinase [Methylocapsa acidiphila]|uniref:bifunctional hydroxymethylpyrimidine kinase/phosphomethylpyrimidine kinase n=1 Tax=Methylocapsa acidiphila TaxID=133552 RepID=UPI00047E962F|nr:bifunctional hydroxymethylpyrimidine kinase/phosphomethylpyrimidine kinase [Methylocapsa acidiphila]